MTIARILIAILAAIHAGIGLTLATTSVHLPPWAFLALSATMVGITSFQGSIAESKAAVVARKSIPPVSIEVKP